MPQLRERSSHGHGVPQELISAGEEIEPIVFDDARTESKRREPAHRFSSIFRLNGIDSGNKRVAKFLEIVRRFRLRGDDRLDDRPSSVEDDGHDQCGDQRNRDCDENPPPPQAAQCLQP